MKALKEMTVEDVRSVYSGKHGCACGCRGKHSYNSKHVAEASKDRGYPVTQDDVNDAQVRKVLGLLKAAEAEGKEIDENEDNSIYALQTETRLYIVYQKEEAAAS